MENYDQTYFTQYSLFAACALHNVYPGCNSFRGRIEFPWIWCTAATDKSRSYGI